MLSELWMHIGKFISLVLVALFILLGWASSRAYVSHEWDHVHDLLWRALEKRRWRERSLPFWAKEVADFYPLDRPNSSPPSDEERLAVMAWGRGAVTPRELTRSEALTRRSIERLESWVSVPHRGVEKLLLGWGWRVFHERCVLACIGWRRITVPFWRRLASEAAHVGKFVAVPAIVLAFAINATIGQTLSPDAGLMSWVGFGVGLGTILSFVIVLFQELRVLLRLAGFIFPSGALAIFYWLILGSVLVAVYSMQYWMPRVQSGLIRNLEKVPWPEWGSEAAGLLVLAGLLLAGGVMQARTALDRRRSLKERNDGALGVVSVVWLLLSMVLFLAPNSILPISDNLQVKLLFALTCVAAAAVFVNLSIGYVLFRRRLTLVRRRRMVVCSRYQWKALAGGLGALACSLILLDTHLITLMSFAHAMIVVLTVPVAFLVVVWQVLERGLWTRKVDRAFSEVSAFEESGSSRTRV